MWGLYGKNIVFIFFILFLSIIIFFILLKEKEHKYIKKFLNIFNKKFIYFFFISLVLSIVITKFTEYKIEKKYIELENKNKFNLIIYEPLEELKNVNKYIAKFENQKIILYTSKNEKIYNIGDKINVVGKFFRPEKARNEGGFSYELYYKQNNIYGSIKAENIKYIRTEKYKINFFIFLKSLIKEKILDNLNEKEAGIVLGLVTGDTSSMSQEIKELFRKSNLSHILAVSGLHISYVVLAVKKVLSILKVSKRKVELITIIFMWLFVFITGASLSSLRAGIMHTLVIFAGNMYRRTSIINNIFLAFFLTIIISPYNAINVGVLLSYGGVIGIIIFNNVKVKFKERVKERKNKVVKLCLDAMCISLSVQIIILPITLKFFNNLNISFLISSIISLPFISFLLIISYIYIIVILVNFKAVSIFISYILKVVLNIFSSLLSLISKIEIFNIIVTTPNNIEILLYYLVVMLILLKFSNSKLIKKFILKIIKIIIIMCLIICITIKTLPAIEKTTKIYFIDVGQGDACLLITPNGKKILIDGGERNEEEKISFTKSNLIKILLSKGVYKIDYAIISHFDEDHSGGIISVIKYLKVDTVIIGKQGERNDTFEEFYQIIKLKNAKLKVIKKGDIIKFDNTTYLKCLWPEDNLIKENVVNNNSLVFKIIQKNFSILFTGDIEEIAENKITNTYKDNLKELKADIIKIAHHGSKTSTTYNFIKAVLPQIALIGVRKR